MGSIKSVLKFCQKIVLFITFIKPKYLWENIIALAFANLRYLQKEIAWYKL